MNGPENTADTTPAGDGFYVYCVAEAKNARVLGPIGLENNIVYTLTGGDLCAVVHACSSKPYQSRTPEIVGHWVLAHQRVICTAGKMFGTVLPTAFNTIVLGNQNGSAGTNLRGWLEDRQDHFRRLLQKLSGKAEYGVQVFLDRKRIAETLVQSSPELRMLQEQIEGRPAGTAYMLQQKLGKAARAVVEEQATQYAEKFYMQIRQCVADIRVDKLKKTQPDRQMLLNLSCLVEKDYADLGQTLEDVQGTEGISVRFTGPWPAYSFVSAGG